MFFEMHAACFFFFFFAAWWSPSPGCPFSSTLPFSDWLLLTCSGLGKCWADLFPARVGRHKSAAFWNKVCGALLVFHLISLCLNHTPLSPESSSKVDCQNPKDSAGQLLRAGPSRAVLHAEPRCMPSRFYHHSHRKSRCKILTDVEGQAVQ